MSSALKVLPAQSYLCVNDFGIEMDSADVNMASTFIDTARLLWHAL